MASARLPSNKRMRLRNAIAASNAADTFFALRQSSPSNTAQTFQRESVEELSEFRRDSRSRKASLVPSDPKPASISSSVKKPAVRCAHPDFWRTCDIPVEIFEIIAISLSRDDLLRMRLVNRDFEKKISRHVFRTVVVPFNPNIYGMVDKETGKVEMKVCQPHSKLHEYSFRALAFCVYSLAPEPTTT